MSDQASQIDTLCIQTIRTLSIDAVEKANSGHPGLPLGAAPMAYVLWQNHLNHFPKAPHWPNRDRFILSAGHGSMLLYSLLHLTGYELPLSEITSFRQWKSKTPGHPEAFLTPGVEATTGPLGQGAANAVGFAIAERSLAQLFNKPEFELVNHFTYTLVSDGDLMEGVSSEAASLAGHLKLGKLIYLYDANDITLDGPTSLTFSTEDVAKRYEAYGWHVVTVQEGDEDYAAIDNAIEVAKKETQKPSLVIVKTTIGYGSPNKQGTSSAHGSPLGEKEVALTKKSLHWDPEKKFFVPDAAREQFEKALYKGKELYDNWNKMFENYTEKFPEFAIMWQQAHQKELPALWDKALPCWGPEEKLATRQASGAVLNELAKKIPWLIGGDADLSCSTNTLIKDSDSFEGQSGTGRNIRFGVREHAMTAIASGMSYHQGLIPFVATFFCFSDYMRPSIRLAAMNHLQSIYVWTHDSIGLGEDGPTHQPVEHLAALRAMPNLTLVRPCDALETLEAWKLALQNKTGPTGLVLTRQKLPVLDRKVYASERGLKNGAYILAESNGKTIDAILIASGSEVHLALEAKQELETQGVATRVVSMPSMDLFEKQSTEYQQKVLPPSIKAKVAIEAGASFGWHRWVGPNGKIIGLDRFGASAPGDIVLEKLGFNTQNVIKAVQSIL